jgi:hypothetical protein
MLVATPKGWKVRIGAWVYMGAVCSSMLGTWFEFSNKSQLIRGLAILTGHNPNALYPALALWAVMASFRAATIHLIIICLLNTVDSVQEVALLRSFQ